MKKIALILISLMFIASCNNTNGITFPDSFGDNQNGSFKTDFDGQTYSTTQTDYSVINRAVIITGIKTNTNEIFTLRVENFSQGTFSFDGSHENSAIYIANDPGLANIWSTINQPPSGELTITEINSTNNTISGNFIFTGTHQDGSSKSFTDGIFTNIPLKVNPITNDTYSAKVDGVDYVYNNLFVNQLSVGANDIVMINANKSNGEILSISLPSNIAVGEHNFSLGVDVALGQYTVGGTTYIADGKINIIEHDTTNKTIKATFEFDASPIISSTPNFEITEGKFEVSY